jgi:hypothetical protein
MRHQLRRSVERHPLLWVAAAATAAVVAVDGGHLTVWLVVALAVGIPGIVGLRAIPPVALLLALAAAVLHGARTLPQDAARRWIEAAGASSAEVTARVVSRTAVRREKSGGGVRGLPRRRGKSSRRTGSSGPFPIRGTSANSRSANGCIGWGRGAFSKPKAWPGPSRRRRGGRDGAIRRGPGSAGR